MEIVTPSSSPTLQVYTKQIENTATSAPHY